MTIEIDKGYIINGYDTDRSWYTDQEPPDDYDPGAADAFFDEKENEYNFEKRVVLRKADLRVSAEARRRLNLEENPPAAIPTFKRLDEFLAEPPDDVPFRIQDVMPSGGRIILAANAKAGKSQIVDNLIRSLVDGDDFLDRFNVNSLAKHVVLIDVELPADTKRRWLADQGIQNTAAVTVISLRGLASAFNIIDPRVRADWAAKLRAAECDFLILDCLRPILDAIGLEEHHDAGKFLVAFDALLTEAGINDATIVHHMGHASERSRGDSRIIDWPDGTWKLVYGTGKDAKGRFFSATGRDIEVGEGRIKYDQTTRRISYLGGSRDDAVDEAAMYAVIDVLADDAVGENTGLSQRGLEDALKPETGQKATRVGAKLAVERSLATVEPGPKKSYIYRIKNPCDVCGKPVASGAFSHLACQK